MSSKNDFENLFSDIIDSTQKATESIASKCKEFIKDSGLDELKDYYPFYNWPPLNLYMSDDNCLIFEFGLSGFVKDDVNIAFEDDYMLFSTTLSNIYSTGDKIRTFKNKLKISDIGQQKYFVPKDRYDRKNYSMHMKNGLLRLVFTPLAGE